MNKPMKTIISILFLIASSGSIADVKITSPNGNEIIFSQKKEGENIDPHAWEKIFFVHANQKYDLSRDDRYYTEDGSTRISPSGEYLKVTSVSGGYVFLDNGEKKYTDRAYCSVIDMKNGCIVSDWDGEACAYDWAKGKDILSEYPDGYGDKFDFLLVRPKMKISGDPFSSYSLYDVKNLLRCDMPEKSNINVYQKLLNENPLSKKIVSTAVVNYLSSLKKNLVMNSKTPLYSSPNNNSKTNAYLVAGDKVMVIQTTPDNEWINVGYINSKNTPLIAWIKR